MEYFPPALERLTEQFAKLPGVGRKSAQRLAFFVLSLPEEDAREFADTIVAAKTSISLCPVCRNFSRAYLRHLFKAEEVLALRLAVLHNLYFYNQLMARIREALESGTFAAFRARYSGRLEERA